MSLTQLFGRLHPLLVHFPIGILLLAFLLECLSWPKRFKKIRPAVQPVLLIGIVTSVFSVVSGLMLAEEGGYDEALLFNHRNLGIATTVISLFCYIARSQSRLLSPDKIKRKRIRFLFLLPVVLLVSLTGHFGGSLTHGEDYLTDFFSGSPEVFSTQVNFNVSENIDEAVMYTDIVEPILESKCYSCHSSKKQKGQLRLDGIDFIDKGGKHGKVLTAGIPDSSSLYHRLVLPLEDKKHMPPNEKPQLSSAEIDLIHSWVSGGYSFSKKVSDFSDHGKIKEFVVAIQSIQTQKKSWVPDMEVLPANDIAIRDLKDRGILVTPVAQGSNYLMVNFVNARATAAKELKLLLPLKDQLLWLNLEQTNISDSSILTIAGLKALRILYLNNTSINDSGIIHLSQLPELVYLNLVGTRVTDASLATLETNKKLETLFLYGTGVTQTAIRELMSKHPLLKIDTGNYQLPALPTDTIVFKRKKA